MSYLNSVTIIGFLGADPEQRQARNNSGWKFTVLSVATQPTWKNTDDEWVSDSGQVRCFPGGDKLDPHITWSQTVEPGAIGSVRFFFQL